LIRKPVGKEHLEKLDIDGSILLGWIKRKMAGYGLDSSGTG
jgi:hypothetical protein